MGRPGTFTLLGVHMLTGLAALEHTDWSRLHHAYGRATDTPGHLRALLREDRESREKAMSHLWSAIIHQGTPWTATGPAALVVAGLLSDGRLDHGEPIRANLLSFLACVAGAPARAGWSIEELERLAAFDIGPLLDAGDDDALYGTEDAANSFYARSILGCIEVVPLLMQAVLEGLANSSPRVRACAAMSATTLAHTESLRHFAKDLESRLLALARCAWDNDERSAHMLALGDLGFSPTEFLEDPSPAVRLCAALAPGLEADPAATAVLIRALENAGSIDEWFVERPPQFAMRPRFTVVARLVERVKDFERLVAAAEAVVQVTSASIVDFDWGPLLVAAFPDGNGTVATGAQRRFLRALVNRAELWDPGCGNAYKWFEKAGLPYDRRRCAERIGQA
jgi:hypothetical protein